MFSLCISFFVAYMSVNIHDRFSTCPSGEGYQELAQCFQCHTHIIGILIITVIFSKSTYSVQTLFNIQHIFHKCLQLSITINFSLVNTGQNPLKKCFRPVSMVRLKMKQTVRIM